MFGVALATPVVWRPKRLVWWQNNPIGRPQSAAPGGLRAEACGPQPCRRAGRTRRAESSGGAPAGRCYYCTNIIVQISHNCHACGAPASHPPVSVGGSGRIAPYRIAPYHRVRSYPLSARSRQPTAGSCVGGGRGQNAPAFAMSRPLSGVACRRSPCAPAPAPQSCGAVRPIMIRFVIRNIIVQLSYNYYTIM